MFLLFLSTVFATLPINFKREYRIAPINDPCSVMKLDSSGGLVIESPGDSVVSFDHSKHRDVSHMFVDFKHICAHKTMVGICIKGKLDQISLFHIALKRHGFIIRSLYSIIPEARRILGNRCMEASNGKVVFESCRDIPEQIWQFVERYEPMMDDAGNGIVIPAPVHLKPGEGMVKNTDSDSSSSENMHGWINHRNLGSIPQREYPRCRYRRMSDISVQPGAFFEVTAY